MLLDRILEQPADAPQLLFRTRGMGADLPDDLVREVLAMANGVFEGPRYIVFGVEPTPAGLRRPGIDRTEGEQLRRACRLLGALIEPRLQLTPIFAEVDRRLLGALEIDACDNPPYVLSDDLGPGLPRGGCWVRDGTRVRSARRQDLDAIYAARRSRQGRPVQVGLGDDARCEVLTLAVPDTSRPPSRRALEQLGRAIQAKKAAAAVPGGDDTGMARLAHARIFGADAPFVPRGMDTLLQRYEHIPDEYRAADEHYFNEMQAVRLNLVVANLAAAPLDDVVLDLSLPRADDFDVVDRLCPDPADGRSAIELRLMGYPSVQRRPGAARVHARLGRLAPGEVRAAFETPLRLAVGSAMRGRKVAIRYAVAAADLARPVRGRLKIVFAR